MLTNLLPSLHSRTKRKGRDCGFDLIEIKLLLSILWKKKLQ